MKRRDFVRATALVWFVLVALVSGCDPVGLRRVDLRLHDPLSEASRITVDAPDVHEALQIFDAAVLRHGFQLVSDEHSRHEGDYVRVYAFNCKSETNNGNVYTRTVACRARLTPTGLEATFGQFGLLGANPEAEGLFIDVRATFIKRYGKKNVTSHRLGARSPAPAE